MISLSRFTLVASLMAGPLFADVITVGGPNGDHAQISTAVAAAQDGDTLLVDLSPPFGYENFTVTNKALTILPKYPSERIKCQTITIEDLSAGKHVFLRGAGVDYSNLIINDCLGSVRLTEGLFGAGAAISNSLNVSIDNSVFEGGGPGMRVTDSQVAIYSSTIFGSWNPVRGGTGYTGMIVTGTSQTFVGKSHISGGMGGWDIGFSVGYGGNGGPGLISTPGSTLLLDSTVQGGPGGFGTTSDGANGPQGSGFLVIPGQARTMDARSSILDTKPIVLTFLGEPGDSVEYAYSDTTQFSPSGADIGPALVQSGMGSGFLPAGTIPASGELRVTIHMGNIPQQEEWSFALQSRSTATNGQVFYSNSSWMVVYDQCTGSVPIGANYCSPGHVNSTGGPASIQAYGSDCATANQVTLILSNVPNRQFGMFLCSQGQGFVQNPGGAFGNLCLGGGKPIGRFLDPGQLQLSDHNTPILGWYYRLDLDLNLMPRPTPGYDVVTANQTWNFQAWYRDNAQSRFSDAIAIRFN